jgi:hypothetical protein
MPWAPGSGTTPYVYMDGISITDRIESRGSTIPYVHGWDARHVTARWLPVDHPPHAWAGRVPCQCLGHQPRPSPTRMGGTFGLDSQACDRRTIPYTHGRGVDLLDVDVLPRDHPLHTRAGSHERLQHQNVNRSSPTYTGGVLPDLHRCKPIARNWIVRSPETG